MENKPTIETWTGREAVARSGDYRPHHAEIEVTVRTPGTYEVEGGVLITVHVWGHVGYDNRDAEIDLHVDDLDRFVATLAAAIDAGRRDGILPALGQEGSC